MRGYPAYGLSIDDFCTHVPVWAGAARLAVRVVATSSEATTSTNTNNSINNNNNNSTAVEKKR